MMRLLTVLLWSFAVLEFSSREAIAELRAGAAVVDATPIQFPVFVNGGMTSRSLDVVKTKINVRAIVLADGDQRIGIAVVDSCMMARPFLDEVKQLASQRTSIRPDRMLISATHTHSAPASMGCLGTDADPTYVPYLREKIAEALAAAEANIEPARVGWAVANAAEFTALRRWIRRPDRLAADPFGNLTVRANMHAGANWDDVTGESGPEDPDLSLISFQAKDGRPIAVLANFSMHYFSGERGLSADYFGLFSEGLKARLAPDDITDHAPFVGIMSHGCSGDIWRRDYRIPAEARHEPPTIEAYADSLLEIALKAYQSISYDDDADLAMAETRMELKYRVPDKQRLEWSHRIVDGIGDRLPQTPEEVYAKEQIILHERQSTEIVLQALRIGDIAIATTPNETYALTGLKLKLQSPLPRTMVIELANGGDGYIPPPEQHLLGGYNTWAARSAGLEVQAEPKIAAAGLQLLEAVVGKSRQQFRQSQGPAVTTILAAKPVAYWRLDEFAGPEATDSSGHDHHALYEPAVAYFLEGPRADLFCVNGEENRAAHFAGGRLRSRSGLGDQYSVSLWFWNGLPTDARNLTGWLFSRGHDLNRGDGGEHLGLGGGDHHPGQLVFSDGSNTVAGQTTIERWSWNHVLFVRDGKQVRVYLNGNATPEIDTEISPNDRVAAEQLFFGGHCSGDASWEGRLDEIAVFDRAVTVAEMVAE